MVPSIAFSDYPMARIYVGTLDGQSVDERLESPVSTSAEKHANVFNPVGACITFRMWSFLSWRDYSNLMIYLCANLLRNHFCFAGSFSKQLERLYAQEAAVAAENPSPSDCFVCVLDRGLIWLCKTNMENISVDMSGTY